MQSTIGTYSLPRWRLTRWLADAGPGVPDDIRAALIGGLYGTLPVFAGGVLNTLAVSGVIAARMQTAPFIAWFALEVAICLIRLAVLVTAWRAAREGREAPTDIYLLLGLAWSSSVGYGVFISMTSGDWVSATLACLSAAAMVGGICFRNFSAPRLAGAMILTSLGPCLPGAALAGEPLLYVVFFQIPIYLFAMSMAAFKLNKMLIATMLAERENDHRARHDALTGLSNRMDLVDAVDARMKTPNADGAAMALLFLDLDGFKKINDTYGHAAGDRLLKMVADRLRGAVRADDLSSRVGGDEFVVLSEGLTRDGALDLAQRLIANLEIRYDLGDGITAKVGVSVGIAMAPTPRSMRPNRPANRAAAWQRRQRWSARCAVSRMKPRRPRSARRPRIRGSTTRSSPRKRGPRGQELDSRLRGNERSVSKPESSAQISRPSTSCWRRLTTSGMRSMRG